MNSTESNPNFELPAMPDADGIPGVSPESLPSTPELYSKPQQPAVSSTQPQTPAQAQPFVNVQDGTSSQSQSSNPVIADDNDLIEKEWVIKAKQIVAATKEDPFAQNREMSKFKADYLKKRYNKDIKIEEA